MTDKEKELRKLQDQMLDIIERKSGRSVAPLHKRIQKLLIEVAKEKKC